MNQCSRRSPLRKSLSWFGLLTVAVIANAQQPKSDSVASGTPPGIAEAWSGLLQGAIPQTQPDATVSVAQLPVKKGAGGDFENHFFFDSRTEYWRENAYFTGHPTSTGVIDAPVTGIFNPAGIPDPSVFQPSANRIYSILDLGTRGWLSDRVNTHFLIRYRQDLTHVDQGSPELTILNTFRPNRRLEFLTGSIEINGRPTDGFFAGSSLQVGRQEIYGAELATIDGASYTVNRKSFGVTLYAGRRFTFFSDPDQRVVGGGNFILRFANASSLEYDALFYIKGTHVVSYRRHLGPSWLLSTSYRMIGSYPIDFLANGLWSPSNGRTVIRLSFAQKLTNKDYFYDYTLNARDLDPHNPLLRLYLGPESPHSQFVIDARRTLTSRLRLAGAVWMRRLNDSKDRGPFDTSFEDYRANAQFFPMRRVETFFEYHERDSDRLSPFGSTDPFDVSQAGETKIQDFSAEIGRSFFGEGRLQLKAGGFYRRMSFQDYFYVLNHLHDRGLLASANLKMDDHTRIYANWDLDTDFFIFRPSIKNSQILRIGLAWRY